MAGDESNAGAEGPLSPRLPQARFRREWRCFSDSSVYDFQERGGGFGQNGSPVVECRSVSRLFYLHFISSDVRIWWGVGRSAKARRAAWKGWLRKSALPNFWPLQLLCLSSKCSHFAMTTNHRVQCSVVQVCSLTLALTWTKDMWTESCKEFHNRWSGTERWDFVFLQSLSLFRAIVIYGFSRFCWTWTKRYLTTSQTRIKCVGRIFVMCFGTDGARS